MQDEQLSPLDLCDEQNTTIRDLLTQHGALPGAEATELLQARQQQQAHEGVDGGTSPDDETISVRTPRPTTPSRRSFVSDPVFETDQQEAAASSPYPSRVPTPAPVLTPPPDLKTQGPGILKKAFSLMKKKPPTQQPSDSILSSVVGLYAAQMTMLAAGIIGK